MSERPTDGAHTRIPEEDRPDGAIPTAEDADPDETGHSVGPHIHHEVPELPETMIDSGPRIEDEQPRPDGPTHEVVTASGTVIDVEGVEEEAEAMIAEAEEPLPVGAHDPANAMPSEPPGMPHQPDDLDREMCALAQHNVDTEFERRNLPRVRPDQATVQNARAGTILDLRARTVRQALLKHIADLSEEERKTVSDYAAALRTVQESRDAYQRITGARQGAEEALYALGIDVAEDHATPEPKDEYDSSSRIPDDMIH